MAEQFSCLLDDDPNKNEGAESSGGIILTFSVLFTYANADNDEIIKDVHCKLSLCTLVYCQLLS